MIGHSNAVEATVASPQNVVQAVEAFLRVSVSVSEATAAEATAVEATAAAATAAAATDAEAATVSGNLPAWAKAHVCGTPPDVVEVPGNHAA